MQQGHWDWLYVHTQAVEHHDASRQALFQMLDISSKSEREMIAARVNAGMAWSMAELGSNAMTDTDEAAGIAEAILLL